MIATCGFCGGRGLVPTPSCDSHGWPNTGPRERVCEYCGGEGAVDDGNKLETCRVPPRSEPTPYQPGPYY